MRYPKLTAEFIQECRDKGIFQKDIAKIIGCDRQLVIKRTKRFNIKFIRNKIKYPVFNEFFYTWSHDMAYILGFIMTDGYVRKTKNRNHYQLKIEVNVKDIEVLEFIKSKISPTRPIRKNIIHKNKSGIISLSAELLITVDIKTYETLNQYGVITKKSGKEIVPPNMPKEYIWSFICGVFDGDGCVHKRKQGEFDWSICTSSDKFAEELNSITNIYNSKVRKNRSVWIISIRDKINVRNIREKMYENVNFCLRRKYDILQEV